MNEEELNEPSSRCSPADSVTSDNEEDKRQAKAIRRGWLTHLYISQSGTDEGEHTHEALRQTRGITSLHYHQTRTTPIYFNLSSLLKHPLRSLKIKRFGFGLDEEFPSLYNLIQRVTTLTYLNVDYDDTVEHPNPYFDTLRNNKDLRVIKIEGVFDDDMLDILVEHKNIEKLAIGLCSDVPLLMTVINHNPYLTSLSLKVERGDALPILTNCHLRKLKIVWEIFSPEQKEFEALITLIETSTCLEYLYFDVDDFNIKIGYVIKLLTAVAGNRTLKSLILPRIMKSMPKKDFLSMFVTNSTLCSLSIMDIYQRAKPIFQDLCDRNRHNRRVYDSTLVQRLLSAME